MGSTVAIIGVGLIGGSLGLKLKQEGFARTVVGCGRNPENLETAKTLGCIDSWTHDPVIAVKDVDLVVVATPVGTIKTIFEQIASTLTDKTVITDVGSVKGEVYRMGQQLLPYPDMFVPGHPIAGTEDSGASASDASLYLDERWILTPEESTSADAQKLVRDMVRCTGANLEEMTPEKHDHIFGWVSHVPHLIAFALADALHSEDDQMFTYGGGGLRDFLRIAASDPVMWKDIFAANSTEIEAATEKVIAHVDKLIAELKSGNMESLLGRVRGLVRHGREQ